MRSNARKRLLLLPSLVINKEGTRCDAWVGSRSDAVAGSRMKTCTARHPECNTTSRALFAKFNTCPPSQLMRNPILSAAFFRKIPYHTIRSVISFISPASALLNLNGNIFKYMLWLFHRWVDYLKNAMYIWFSAICFPTDQWSWWRAYDCFYHVRT